MKLHPRRAAVAGLLLAAVLLLPACLIATTPPITPAGNESLTGGNAGAREGLVISQLRSIARAEQFYFTQEGRYGSLKELVSARLLNQLPRIGYTIELTLEEDGSAYILEAVPTDYGKTGRRSFYMDESGTIRGADHDGGAPSASDPIAN